MGDLFGVAVSPFELQEWEEGTGIRPDLCMVFEAWSRQRPLTDMCNKAKALGHTSIALTWEPWTPTPLGTSPDVQGREQARWCHRSILAGDHDDYIDDVARSLRDSGLTIYLRYAHEMNGGWYPWHNDPDLYVAAWKYLRNRIRPMRNAWNVKFVWAPNPDLWRTSPADWLRGLLPYWPGASQVDYLGSTMIEFGDEREYPISLFAQRFALMRTIFQKSLLAMEVNVARGRAVEWLADLTTYVGNGSRPLPAVILSQGSSRAEAAGSTGDLGWTPMNDAGAREALIQLRKALHDN